MWFALQAVGASVLDISKEKISADEAWRVNLARVLGRLLRRCGVGVGKELSVQEGFI